MVMLSASISDNVNFFGNNFRGGIWLKEMGKPQIRTQTGLFLLQTKKIKLSFHPKATILFKGASKNPFFAAPGCEIAYS